jgi:hypothetical protein
MAAAAALKPSPPRSQFILWKFMVVHRDILVQCSSHVAVMEKVKQLLQEAGQQVPQDDAFIGKQWGKAIQECKRKGWRIVGYTTNKELVLQKHPDFNVWEAWKLLNDEGTSLEEEDFSGTLTSLAADEFLMNSTNAFDEFLQTKAPQDGKIVNEFIKQFKSLLEQWNLPNIQVRVFGSRALGVNLLNSDIDVCLDASCSSLVESGDDFDMIWSTVVKEMSSMDQFSDISEVKSAKTPIIKFFWAKEFRLT